MVQVRLPTETIQVPQRLRQKGSEMCYGLALIANLEQSATAQQDDCWFSFEGRPPVHQVGGLVVAALGEAVLPEVQVDCSAHVLAATVNRAWNQGSFSFTVPLAALKKRLQDAHASGGSQIIMSPDGLVGWHWYGKGGRLEAGGASSGRRAVFVPTVTAEDAERRGSWIPLGNQSSVAFLCSTYSGAPSSETAHPRPLASRAPPPGLAAKAVEMGPPEVTIVATGDGHAAGSDTHARGWGRPFPWEDPPRAVAERKPGWLNLDGLSTFYEGEDGVGGLQHYFRLYRLPGPGVAAEMELPWGEEYHRGPLGARADGDHMLLITRKALVVISF